MTYASLISFALKSQKETMRNPKGNPNNPLEQPKYVTKGQAVMKVEMVIQMSLWLSLSLWTDD